MVAVLSFLPVAEADDDTNAVSEDCATPCVVITD